MQSFVRTCGPAILAVVGFTLFPILAGCEGVIPGTGGDGNGDNGNDNDGSVFNNTTDPTNKSATFVGSNACRACHPDIDAWQSIHGHAHKLTRVQGAPPEFPEEGTRAGVPNPPEGIDWSDVAYVIGGYTRKARFIDNDGYILTTGLEGVDTQWNLSYPANGTTPGFVPYDAERETEKPYDFSCFQCHTTGALAQDEDQPEFQDNRPGFAGTWEEAGVQCEACHGPGSNHIPNPEARDIYVNVGADHCGQCHTRGSDPDVILASGGFVRHHEQWPELRASGGHADFDCIVCHDPHRSTNYDRENAIRNECTDCHTDHNMAVHDGITYVRGDYVETLSCESCHMAYATRSAASASTDVVGELGRMGDTRSHIFRIDDNPVDYTSMFSNDMESVRKDALGRAAVTVDFVCLRCHNGVGNAFELTIQSAASIANNMHEIQN